MRGQRLQIRFTEQEMQHLDAIRGPVARSTFVRRLLAEADTAPAEAADHAEAMALLSAKARAGSVNAQVALERATREVEAKAARAKVLDSWASMHDELADRRARGAKA